MTIFLIDKMEDGGSFVLVRAMSEEHAREIVYGRFPRTCEITRLDADGDACGIIWSHTSDASIPESRR